MPCVGQLKSTPEVSDPVHAVSMVTRHHQEFSLLSPSYHTYNINKHPAINAFFPCSTALEKMNYLLIWELIGFFIFVGNDYSSTPKLGKFSLVFPLLDKNS